RTPEALREKLKRARALAQISAAATTLDTVAEASSRAERLVWPGEAERALAPLRSAWVQRRDMRLISLAQRAIAQAPGTFAAIAAEAEAQYESLQQLREHQRWLSSP